MQGRKMYYGKKDIILEQKTSSCGDRTHDLKINSPALYQLS